MVHDVWKFQFTASQFVFVKHLHFLETADILQTNDALVKVMDDYKAKFGDPKANASDVPTAEEAMPSSSGRYPTVKDDTMWIHS